jgi:AAA+ ATPase superfamily predicted ATPase
MFVGRKNELSKLERMYEKSSFEFAVVYGRRRVGKTTLINEFCRNKRNVYFVSVEATAKENLENLSKAIFDALVPNRPAAGFESFEKALEFLFEQAKKERFVFVIDEFPYLAGSYPAISSILQKHIDKNQDESRLFLLLSGSSMSFMEFQVLGYASPLYGRRTAQFKILPFTYFEAVEMLPGFDDEERAVLYGVTGGIPEYLARIDNRLSMKKNIVELFLTPSGRLFEEPSNLLKQELRDPQTYHGILSAIAGGSSRLNQIATRVGIETGGCSNLLSTLIALGIVRRDTPVTEPNAKKTIYLLEDTMFRFWFRFVGPNRNGIVAGFGEKVYDAAVEPELSNFMGSVFEEICKQYLLQLAGQERLPFYIGNIGRWWGNNAKERREEEIDILAFSEDKAIFGECKWTKSLVDVAELDDLKAQSRLFHFSECYYYLFARKGFSDALQQRGKQEPVHLVSFEEMNSAAESRMKNRYGMGKPG